MKLTSEQLEIFRRSILDVLNANLTRFGLPARAILTHCQVAQGLQVDESQVLDQLDYLQRREPPLVEEVEKVISRERQNWRITEAGRAFLDA
jgi:hypothetical protein